MAKLRFKPDTIIRAEDTVLQVQGVNITRDGDFYDVKVPNPRTSDITIEQISAQDLKKIKDTQVFPLSGGFDDHDPDEEV